jgi:hypothetical protein
MIAFNISIVIRIATGDNPKQKTAALALLDNYEVLIPKSMATFRRALISGARHVDYIH